MVKVGSLIIQELRVLGFRGFWLHNGNNSDSHGDTFLAYSTKNVTKTDIYWGSYRILFFVFLTHLRIFAPRLEILFCINLYFILCIFKYPTSTHLPSAVVVAAVIYFLLLLRIFFE